MKNKISVSLCALFCAYVACGSGFQVLEQGAANIGTAMAGATANASSDASSAFWNPSAAVFTNLPAGATRVDAGSNFVIPSFEFRNNGSTNPAGNSGSDGGNAGELAVIPNLWIVHKFTDDMALTFSGTSTYGLETRYDDDWIGRFQGIRSDLVNFDLNPSIAYSPVEWLSLSVGGSLQWMHAELTQAVDMPALGYPIAKLTGSGLSGGMNAGFTIKYHENGRFAFSWRSQVKHDISGNFHLFDTVVNPISCDITLPQTFNVGIYQRFWGKLERLAVMADYSYTGWSSFDKLTIINDATGQPQSNTPENWRDTSRVALGFHYYPMFDNNAIIRWGIAWDQSPVGSASNRTVRIPCTDRIWLSCGAGYSYENMRVDLGYTYIIFTEDPEIRHSEGGYTVNGNFVGHAHVVSIQASIAW